MVTWAKNTDLATRFYVLVSKLRVNKRTVKETLIVNNRLVDIQGDLTVGVITVFLELWHLNVLPVSPAGIILVYTGI
jgi:hypothetical protein